MTPRTLTENECQLAPDRSLTGDLGAWFLTLDPRRTALRHLLLAALFAACGLLAALRLRLELMTPALDTLSPRTFGALLSLHGSLLFYFVALPVFPGALGHSLLLRALGRETTAFPRLSRASWHLLGVGGLTVIVGFLVGGTEAGWSFDAEFDGHFTAPGIVPLATGVFLAALALLLMAVNFVATIATAGRGAATRSPVIAAFLCGSVTALVISPALAGCMVLVLLDRVFGLSLFSLSLGGDPQFFAVLFKFFSGPTQNMLLLFALGTLFAVLARRTPSTGKSRLLPWLLLVITLCGFFAWVGKRCLVAGLADAFCAATLVHCMAIPAAGVVLAIALRQMASGRSRIDTSMLYALGFILTTALALGLGLLVALPFRGAYLDGTTFASGQQHLLLLAVLGMALPAGLHEAWPGLTGRQGSELVGRYAAGFVVLGTFCTFLPMLVLGFQGASYRSNDYPAALQALQVLATGGATLLLGGLLAAAANLVFSRQQEEAP